ncbi:MAG: alpha/beta fold hydrolase [Octadecabacter sp.]
MSSFESKGVKLNHHRANVNGILMHYVTAGDPKKPAVVLLHGFAQSWYEWRRDVIPALAKDYFVVAPDMRGIGDTDKPRDGYDKVNMAEDIWQLVQHLEIQKLCLVGHDFGSAVAYAFAAAHPDTVQKLMITEMIMPGFGYEDCMQTPFAQDMLGRKVWHLAFHDAPDLPEALIQGRERMYLQWFHNNFAYVPNAIPAEDLDEYERSYAAPGGMRALDYYRTHFIDAEHNRELAKTPLKMPVVAVGGAGFLGPMVAMGMNHLAENVREVVIPECGHWVPDEQPEAFNTLLLDFLAETS